MAIYSLDVNESDFRDNMEGHELLDALTDDDYEAVAQAIIDKAGESRDGLYTEFGLWFVSSAYWDEAWDALQQAIDDYIDRVTPLVLKEMEG